MRLLLLGPPGVGKGTYGKLLAKKLNCMLFSLGDLIRDEINVGSKLGKTMSVFSHQGKLIPDPLIIDFVNQSLKSNNGTILLDGFPRTIEQARSFKVDRVINFEMKTEFIVQKLLGRRICSSQTCGRAFNVANVEDEKQGVSMPAILPESGHHEICDCGEKLLKRKDDTEEIISNRLKVYQTETAPLIDYYKSMNILDTFELKRGLDDFPKLFALVQDKLQLKRNGEMQDKVNLNKISESKL